MNQVSLERYGKYDAAGNVRTQIVTGLSGWTGSITITNGFGIMDLLTRVARPVGGSLQAAADYQYDTADRPWRKSYGNSDQVTHGYDAESRSNSAPVLKCWYDGQGRRKAKKTDVGGQAQKRNNGSPGISGRNLDPGSEVTGHELLIRPHWILERTDPAHTGLRPFYVASGVSRIILNPGSHPVCPATYELRSNGSKGQSPNGAAIYQPRASESSSAALGSKSLFPPALVWDRPRLEGAACPKPGAAHAQ